MRDDYGRSWSCSEEEGSIALCHPVKAPKSSEPNDTWAGKLNYFLGILLVISLFVIFFVPLGFKFKGIIRQVILIFEIIVSLDLPFYKTFFIKA